MEFNTNIEYYSDDLTLNKHIDYIVLYKKYLDALLDDIKNGRINKKLIKQASKISRKFFNSKHYLELEESYDIKDYSSESETESEFDFKPMTKVITISDTESEVESDIAIHDGSEDDILQSYKSSNYTKGLLTEYNNSPEFLDTSSDYNNLIDKYTFGSNGYSSNVKQSIKPLTKIEYQQPTYVNKINDKLADEFLNNNLQLNKYYYLKSFNNEQANMFFKACSNY